MGDYNFFYNIECEFLSMLGEMIIRYEMKKENSNYFESLKELLNCCDLNVLENSNNSNNQ